MFALLEGTDALAVNLLNQFCEVIERICVNQCTVRAGQRNVCGAQCEYHATRRIKHAWIPVVTFVHMCPDFRSIYNLRIGRLRSIPHYNPYLMFQRVLICFWFRP